MAGRIIDWVPIREDYLSRQVRPTYAELAADHGLPAATVGRIAVDEGWPLLRAQKMEKAMRESDAAVVVLEAAKRQSAVTQTLAGTALVTLQRLHRVVELLKEDLSPATQANVLNTVSFALSNTAKSLKDAGVVGLPKELWRGADEDGSPGSGGRDSTRQLLQQINVTVQAAVTASQPPPNGVMPVYPEPPAAPPLPPEDVAGIAILDLPDPVKTPEMLADEARAQASIDRRARERAEAAARAESQQSSEPQNGVATT